MQTITILTDRLPAAIKALDKLVKKANRYDNDPITYTIGKPVLIMEQIQKFSEASGRYEWFETDKVVVSHTDIEIDGSAPIYGNHEFLAHVEIGETGNIIDSSPEASVEIDHEFRTSTGRCDHCHTNRQRKDVYIVLDRKTGQQHQIGRTCLRDYMGIDNPKKVAARFAFWPEIRVLEEEYEGWGPSTWVKSISEVLSYTATIIRLYGWCSKGQAYDDDYLTSTCDRVLFASGQRPLPIRGDDSSGREWDQIQDAHCREDYEIAKSTLAWVRRLEDVKADYLWNLKLICESDFITDPKRMGILVSAVSAYHRDVEKALRLSKDRQAAANSNWVGEIKERLRDIPVTLQMQRVIGSGDWGDQLLVKFIDDKGNLFSWFTGTGTGLEIGQQATLTGTVKCHKEYQGAKETVLSRCKVA
jgi:hypothetical protein